MKISPTKSKLSKQAAEELLQTLKARFVRHPQRHGTLDWDDVLLRLAKQSAKLWSLSEMERTGGEPDVVGCDTATGEILFADCVAETPKGRISLCYDRQALDARKENKPQGSVIDMAEAMGIELLSEEQYRHLQTLGEFDTKTSSWIRTPPDIRDRGGALFCDRRYGHVFVYHNGAQSYYAARGFRGLLRA